MGGAGGARGFKSRSFDSFVAALEKGEADHLYAVNPDDVRKGKIALKDVPYMQRGGAWDNSDLKGKKGWMKTGFGMTAFNDGKADIKKMTAKDKAYLNAKPDIHLRPGPQLGRRRQGRRRPHGAREEERPHERPADVARLRRAHGQRDRAHEPVARRRRAE